MLNYTHHTTYYITHFLYTHHTHTHYTTTHITPHTYHAHHIHNTHSTAHHIPQTTRHTAHTAYTPHTAHKPQPPPLTPLWQLLAFPFSAALPSSRPIVPSVPTNSKLLFTPAPQTLCAIPFSPAIPSPNINTSLPSTTRSSEVKIKPPASGTSAPSSASSPAVPSACLSKPARLILALPLGKPGNRDSGGCGLAHSQRMHGGPAL